MKPLYFYGIIPTDSKIIVDEVSGMDNDEDSVYTLPHRGIAAVVGTSPRDDYRGLKRDQAVRYMVNHQSVIEAVQSHFTVLPAKFGTVLPDADAMERMLQQGHPKFEAAVANLNGLTQMEVVTVWNLQQVFQDIGNQPEIMEIKTRIAGLPQDQTLQDRITIGRLVKEAIDQRRSDLTAQIAPRLRNLARDSVTNPVVDDSIVVNVALLLDAAGRNELDAVLEALDKEYDGKMNFRSIGPLPPYSFATVEVQTPDLAAIDAARELLGCGMNPTIDEIKRAYYQAARQVHPDLNTNNSNSDDNMTALTKAYRLLLATADSQMIARSAGAALRGSPEAQEALVCNLDHATIENMLMISVKRQSDTVSAASVTA